MHIIDWVVVGLYLVGVLTSVAMVGKPKKPTTPSVAVVAVGINLTVVIAILWSHGVIA